ncbi:hypothetical protein CH278_01190 [Rhodococcus sp. 05-2254-5]|uniref:hypothetical protein n=1 Tax=unclassified Rhodococcus (in: high G+C Gram-positive bacteria) TaxID=192944 RepID=UPI000B9BFEA5|nr:MULTISPECIES: hypothetical protein [unclassified Rhodococcus (in: high G+C Gram-positive bacteria)]OZE38956.1 hypothetical protein CH278_01190 [Rhodococcus sp. 05-2254-5]OZE58895.1 hypothetical protein CH269_07685 [Rhodococcus sp. 05-2254-1]
MKVFDAGTEQTRQKDHEGLLNAGSSPIPTRAAEPNRICWTQLSDEQRLEPARSTTLIAHQTSDSRSTLSAKKMGN